MVRLPEIIDDFDAVPPLARGAVVVIGNFDGVHKGHQALIADARKQAQALGTKVGVLVFEPHPAEYFGRATEPFRLAPLNAKVHMLGDYGVDFVYVCTFNEAVATLSAEDFVTKVLVDALGAAHVVVGYDFRFGHDRSGDTEMLRRLGQERGFELDVVSAVRTADNGDVYSSTLIRNHLKAGRPADAAELLGHPWYVEGPVMQGDQRGRTIGFPTANVSMNGYLEPKFGVYAVLVEVESGPHEGDYLGVANIGKRPTFDKQEVNLEVHLFDFDGDLYGTTVRVSFVEFLRAEQKFDGLDALKAQIAADCDEARARLGADAA